MALDYEWQLYTKQEKNDAQGFYKVWLEGEGESQSVIMYIEDDFLELRYISVEGINARSLADQIRASVDTYTRDELEDNIAHAERHEDWISALLKIGASQSNMFEPWAFDSICKGLDHSDSRVRLAALAATGLTTWPEFIAPLCKLQERDNDIRILRRTARLLGLLDGTSRDQQKLNDRE